MSYQWQQAVDGVAYTDRTGATNLVLQITNVQVADLAYYPLPEHRYDLIININFLMRSLIRPIDQALKSGGLLIFQTYTREDPKFDRDRFFHPEYYLYPRELLDFFPDYRTWYYYEGPLGERQVASLIAVNP